MDEKPNYYAVIPAEVRYNESLRANEKLMYGEITALSNKTGVCTASNNYFARLYSVQPSAISKWISDLQKYDYIEVEYIKEGKEIKKRIIKIKGSHKCEEVVTNEEEGYSQKDNRGYSQKDKENNTSNINNTSINNKKKYIKEKYGTYKRIKLTDDEYKRLIEDYGEDFIKQQIEKLDEYIESNNNKNKYTNFNLVLRKSIREKWFEKKETRYERERRLLEEMCKDE